VESLTKREESLTKREESLTPRGEALHRALGWEPPTYVYLPAITALPPGDTLAAYRARGYMPLALANYLARLGWTPRGRRELLSLDELAARFDLQHVSRRPVRFDGGRTGARAVRPYR